ncbi:MAG TPA: hypothetical protein VF292_09370 [Rhodanobacteraceae bacterium]
MPAVIHAPAQRGFTILPAVERTAHGHPFLVRPHRDRDDGNTAPIDRSARRLND